MSRTARKKRFSIDSLERDAKVRERDRNPQPERGGSEECGGSPANFRGMPRAFPAPQWHRLNSLDNSGTMKEEEEKSPSGRHEQRAQGSDASTSRLCQELLAHVRTLLPKPPETRMISCGKRAHNHIHADAFQRRQDIDSYNFSEPPFHAITIHGCVGMARHDYPDSSAMNKGSEVPNLNVGGSDSLPFYSNRLKILFARQPVRAGKTASLRFRRTWTAV